MSNPSPDPPKKLSWRFPRTFWIANGAELCERAAYYGMFITLYRYLNIDIGFTDPQTGLVIAFFAGGLYFLPTFMGIMADKVGFKQALTLAFALLTAGYFLLGAMQLKSTAVLALILIMLGGAIIKPVISGTAAKCSTEDNRARAMSIFYMVVNIGAFAGKSLAGYLNEQLGLQYINFYAAGMTFLALILVVIFYRNVDTAGTGKTIEQALRGLWKVMQNFRFLSLILIIAGFWLIQGQLYGAMPTYIERMLGQGYKPEWLANINPLTVVILVVPITHLVHRFKPENAIGVGLFIIPLTALVISLSPIVETVTGSSVELGPLSIHPLILLVCLGIALQGLAECFLSPKFLEYASKQAPKGEVGLYLGYQHLTTFLAWLAGFVAAGVLLDTYCPDPRKFDPPTRHIWRLSTDARYQFTLDEATRAGLHGGGPIPVSLAQALKDHDLDVPENAVLLELEAHNGWQRDPERRWSVEEPLLKIELIPGTQGGEDTLRVASYALSQSAGGETEEASFALSADLRKLLDDGQRVGAELRTALAEHGVKLPDTAVIHQEKRRDEDAANGWRQRFTAWLSGDDGDAKRVWRVAIDYYTIDEAKLEADADARDAGREKALRDVLLRAVDARAPQDRPPLPSVYDRAHFIWYAFTGVGVLAFLGLLVFKLVTNAIDRHRATTPTNG